MSNHPHLILASGSLQRRDLMQAAGYQFEVVRPRDSAECGMCSGEMPPEMVARLAKQKCEDVVRRLNPKQAVAIGCDTVAECTGRILGKPHDAEHAREMLYGLRGREHRVYSGLCIWKLPEDTFEVAVDVTKLQMDDVPDREIEEYIATELWEGKAGGFGLQDRQGWIHIVEGSESNVIGLPMELLANMLMPFGVAPTS